jgi:hypothetical protein
MSLSMHRAQIANWPKSIEIALAHAQQGKVAFKNLAVGNPRAHGELPINQRVDVDALEVFANKPKSGSYPAAVSWADGSQGGSGRVILATT